MPAEIHEHRSFSPWSWTRSPGKILVMRMHAVGDVTVAMPACGALRRACPAARIDFLTSPACADIPRALRGFDRIHVLDQGAGRLERLRSALRCGLRMRAERYDVIVDLQRHRASRLIRRMAHPHAWGEFDRFSPRHVWERVLDTFHRTGFAGLKTEFSLELRGEVRAAARRILREHGWDETTALLVLNPAGLWPTRHWPLTRYVELAGLWSGVEPVSFLILGTERIADKAAFLTRELAGRVINLTGRTSLAEALGILQFASVVISEDSGLLHMAWTSGIPSVALLGSTRSDWTRPLGAGSRYVGSEDLSCGACMEAACRFGDVHCLTRHSAREIFDLAMAARGGRG